MKVNPRKKAPGRAGYHHGDLRRTLVRIARDQIAESGADAMSFVSLARLAGVSQPAPYRHFSDRKALLEAVTTEGFEEFAAALTAAAAAGGRDGALRAMALAYVAFGEANIELYRLMFASRLVPEAGTGGALETAAVEAFSRLREALSPHHSGGPHPGGSPTHLGPIARAGHAEGRRAHHASLGGTGRGVEAVQTILTAALSRQGRKAGKWTGPSYFGAWKR
ncbi:protein of unknown function [Methylocella tundrae]|uniref:HTH tetR-type domain-containing protein n=1 Tax=Methylocella tundrae TaxID=227605 RepID=A0A4U8Z4I0_METTU|nr:TetR/AcrR family transcriptional regulator [Methylocella tundrae]VFU10201.1 protein of unknown function [Methylocella tundrae]